MSETDEAEKKPHAMRIPYKTLLVFGLVFLCVGLIYSLTVRPVDAQDSWKKQVDMRWLHGILDSNKGNAEVNKNDYGDKQVQQDGYWPENVRNVQRQRFNPNPERQPYRDSGNYPEVNTVAPMHDRGQYIPNDVKDRHYQENGIRNNGNFDNYDRRPPGQGINRQFYPAQNLQPGPYYKSEQFPPQRKFQDQLYDRYPQRFDSPNIRQNRPQQYPGLPRWLDGNTDTMLGNSIADSSFQNPRASEDMFSDDGKTRADDLDRYLDRVANNPKDIMGFTKDKQKVGNIPPTNKTENVIDAKKKILADKLVKAAKLNNLKALQGLQPDIVQAQADRDDLPEEHASNLHGLMHNGYNSDNANAQVGSQNHVATQNDKTEKHNEQASPGTEQDTIRRPGDGFPNVHKLPTGSQHITDNATENKHILQHPANSNNIPNSQTTNNDRVKTPSQGFLKVPDEWRQKAEVQRLFSVYRQNTLGQDTIQNKEEPQYPRRMGDIQRGPITAKQKEIEHLSLTQDDSIDLLSNSPKQLVGLRQKIAEAHQRLQQKAPEPPKEVVNDIQNIPKELAVLRQKMIDENRYALTNASVDDKEVVQHTEMISPPKNNEQNGYTDKTLQQNMFKYANALKNIPKNLIGLRKHVEEQKKHALLALHNQLPNTMNDDVNIKDIAANRDNIDEMDPIELLSLVDWNKPVTASDEQADACITMQTMAKFRICIHSPADDPTVSTYIKNRGSWEGPNIRDMQLLLSSDEKLGLIDIGAGIGLYSLAAAILGRKVVSIEPYSPHISVFKQSVKLNKMEDSIQLFHNFISDTRTKVSVSRPPGKQMNDLVFQTINDTYSSHSGNGIVNSILLNDIAHICPFDSAVLKLDIPGFEYKALKGADEMFNKMNISYVLMHWNPDDTVLCDFATKMFVDRGYRPYRGLVGHMLNVADAKKWHKGRIMWQKEHNVLV